MLKNFTLVAVSLFGTAASSAATMPEYKVNRLPPAFPLPPIEVSTKLKQFSIIQEDPEPKTQTATKEVAPEKTKEKKLICKDCNSNESKTLDFLQSQGITDKNAIATIMGNIKQESRFIPNICEGGNLVPYRSCRSGGYGLIQFTSSDRYYGLGKHAVRIGGNPSVLETQLDYIINEPQWKNIEHKMRIPGKSIESYMSYAFNWIGWGIHGNRTRYAYDYAKRIILEEV
jgi:hypothetical protein